MPEGLRRSSETGRYLRCQLVLEVELVPLIYNPLSPFMTRKFLLPFLFLGAGIIRCVVGRSSAVPSVTDFASLLLLSSESHRLRLSLCHLLWYFRILVPPGMILPPSCLLFTGLGSLLVRGAAAEGFLGEACRLLACFPFRCCGLSRARFAALLPTNSATRSCFAFLASSLSLSPLIWRSS